MKWLLIPLEGDFQGMFALENKGAKGHFLDAGGPGRALVPKKNGWHDSLRWKFNVTERAPPVPFDNSATPPVVAGELPVYYSVRRLYWTPSGSVNHDAIWVGDTAFEVKNTVPVLWTNRTDVKKCGWFNWCGERFYLLGSTPKSKAEVARLAALYPWKDHKYDLLTNNCWNFARWFLERLGFNPKKVPTSSIHR